MDIVKKVMKILALGTVACIVLYIAFIAIMLLIFSYKGYHGKDQDLYSVAVNNVFAVRGEHFNGEVSFDPKIHIIETDDYGRTLFFYNEYSDGSTKTECDYGMAFVIMQSSKDGYAYYYPDKCYIPYFDTVSNWETILAQLEPDYFDAFKMDNDWNSELVEEKCAKVKISNKKPKGVLRPKDDAFDKIIYLYEMRNGYTGTDSSFYKFSIFSEADRYGKELHYVYGMTKNTLRNGQYVFDTYEYAIIFNADGTCGKNGIIRIPTPADSRAAIHELKENNNWNKPD